MPLEIRAKIPNMIVNIIRGHPKYLEKFLFLGNTNGRYNIELISVTRPTKTRRLKKREYPAMAGRSEKNADIIQSPIAEDRIAATREDSSFLPLK